MSTTIPLDALKAISQGEPLDEVSGDYDVPLETVRKVAPLVGREPHEYHCGLDADHDGGCRSVDPPPLPAIRTEAAYRMRRLEEWCSKPGYWWDTVQEMAELLENFYGDQDEAAHARAMELAHLLIPDFSEVAR